MQKRFILALVAVWLCAPARAAEAPVDDVKLVERFLATPTADLPPTAVEHFLAIDPAGLPKKLQQKYKAKKVELYTLRELALGKKKGFVRTPDVNCEPNAGAKNADAGILLMAGYMNITEEDEQCIMEKTKCTEQELMCEFTLQILKPSKKGGQRRLLLYEKDPVSAYMAMCRPGSKVGGQTNFFGGARPICSH